MKEKVDLATAAELAVLKTLWRDGPGTVRQLDDRLRTAGRQWAYTTLQTLLSRLESKGLVHVDRSSFAHVFAAAVSRDEFLNGRLSSLANDVCDGTRLPLMLALVEGAKFSAEDIAQFRELLDSLDRPSKPGHFRASRFLPA